MLWGAGESPPRRIRAAPQLSEDAESTLNFVGNSFQNLAVPLAADGNRARYCKLSATRLVKFRPGGPTATSTMAILPAHRSVILNLTGFDNLRLRTDTGDPSGDVTLAPLENQ